MIAYMGNPYQIPHSQWGWSEPPGLGPVPWRVEILAGVLGWGKRMINASRSISDSRPRLGKDTQVLRIERFRQFSLKATAQIP